VVSGTSWLVISKTITIATAERVMRNREAVVSADRPSDGAQAGINASFPAPAPLMPATQPQLVTLTQLPILKNSRAVASLSASRSPSDWISFRYAGPPVDAVDFSLAE
jgi:hypothetical protein